MRTRYLAAIAAIILVAGCGSSSGGSNFDTRTLSEAELTDTLLTLDDLPPGYEIVESGDESDDDDSDMTFISGSQECFDIFDGMEADDMFVTFDDVEPQSEVEIEFGGGMFGPFLTQEIGAYASGDLDDFAEVWELFDDLFDTCVGESFVAEDDEGERMSMSFDHRDLPDLGDLSGGFSFSITPEAFPITAEATLAFARVGSHMTMLLALSFGDGLTADEFDDIFETAVNKIINAL